jgi:hypothetical protein
VWTRYVDDFLKSQRLQLRTTLLPVPAPAAPQGLRPPPELAADSMPYFREYLSAQTQKAFAISSSGSANYAFGFRAVADARKSALELCQAHGEKCRIAFINNSPVRE